MGEGAAQSLLDFFGGRCLVGLLTHEQWAGMRDWAAYKSGPPKEIKKFHIIFFIITLH